MKKHFIIIIIYIRITLTKVGVQITSDNTQWTWALHVDDPGQLLDPVEQQVPLLNGLLVLPVLTVRPVDQRRRLVRNKRPRWSLGVCTSVSGSERLPVCFHYLIYFVDFAVEPASGDEPRELPGGGGGERRRVQNEFMVNCGEARLGQFPQMLVNLHKEKSTITMGMALGSKHTE